MPWYLTKIYSAGSFLMTLQMPSPSKWTWPSAVTQCVFFSPFAQHPRLWFSASNEYISKRGSRLNKFYVPYQNSHINIICDSKVPSKLQGTYICSTFSKNRGFQRAQIFGDVNMPKKWYVDLLLHISMTGTKRAPWHGFQMHQISIQTRIYCSCNSLGKQAL